jgi:hypothetical protein
MDFIPKPTKLSVFDYKETYRDSTIRVEEVPLDEVIEILGLTPQEIDDCCVRRVT